MNTLFFILSSLSVFTGPIVPVAAPTVGEQLPVAWYNAPPNLPNMPLTTTEGANLNAQALEGKVILVLFQPDCDHCQRGAEAIHEHLNDFDEYTLYFITTAPLADIQQFAKDYQLSEAENVVFAATELQPILDNFGSIPTPSMYIYSGKKLLKALEGETPIEEIVEAL